jgi:hypothetical protein
MDIKKVMVELQRPKGQFPGRVEVGYYVVNEGTVVLVEQNGMPIDRHRLTRKLGPGADAKLTACMLMRQRYSKGGSGDFNRPLQYPVLKF